VRFFDTLRRYETEQDPPARVIPPPPADWDRATAAQFLHAASDRRAAVLETMLGAVEPALRRGELAHATALLDAIEGALDAHGAPDSPLARDYDAIVGLLEAQARALRLGDGAALSRTLATADLATRLPSTTVDLLRDLRYMPVQLDIRGDAAEGLVSVDSEQLDGSAVAHMLYRARFARDGDQWVMTEWEWQTPAIALPPGRNAGDRKP
jgi:hypothetical protein